MNTLQWTTVEAGVVPAARHMPGGGMTVRTSFDAMPGSPVRHMLRAVASEPEFARDRNRWLARVRTLLDREHATLRARFETDGQVEALLRGRARLADGVVVGLLHLARAIGEAHEMVTPVAPLTVLAVGGYGRRELAPASDLDLLFLLAEAPERQDYARRMIGAILTGLWDLGFEVGHATRTLDECRELAQSEPTVLSSLLDARFLVGSLGLHATLDGDVRQTAKEVGAKALAAALVPTLSASRGPTADDEEEPDVKRGRGALRDIQRLLWLARLDHVGVDSGVGSGLAGQDAAVPPVLADARRFLWQVRCHLHLLAGRAQDRLVRELQPLVARRLGLGRGPDAGAAELMDRHHAYTRAVRALLTAP